MKITQWHSHYLVYPETRKGKIYPEVWVAVVLSMLLVMRRPDFRVKQYSSHTFFMSYAERRGRGRQGKMFFSHGSAMDNIKSNIIYFRSYLGYRSYYHRNADT